MSTMTTMATQPTRLPGPTIPAWTQWINNLLPWHVDFDSLSFMLKNARQYGKFYAIWIGDTPIYVVSDPALAHEILVERAKAFHKAALVRHAVGPFAGNGLFLNEGDFWRRQRKLAQPAFHHQRIEAYGTTMVQQTLDLLARAMQIRLIDELREKLGATYGASASSAMSDSYRGFGTFSLSTDGDPKHLEAIEAAVDAVVAEFVKEPMSADLFERARKPALESYADWRKRNPTWLDIVAVAQSKPGRLERFRINETQFRSISREEIWAAAKRFLKDKPSFTFRAIPEKNEAAEASGKFAK